MAGRGHFIIQLQFFFHSKAQRSKNERKWSESLHLATKRMRRIVCSSNNVGGGDDHGYNIECVNSFYFSSLG